MDHVIHSKVRLGHVHLTVADLERSLKFYRDVLGFEITQWFGESAVFLSAGGYHHHIGLNTWAGKDAPRPEENTTGLYHFAILYPNRKELARIIRRLLELNYPIQGASDHGVSESIYIEDPDGIGIELYVDRDREEWPVDDEGHLKMVTKPINLLDLLSELDKY
ncbi:MAG: glyoxalase [Ignavibacteriales bacterium]|jgi:catechol 2,3-dioxygenase|nr:VOC family protein [Ignavibacteriaceae bacterium]NLH61695.1 glyoxalase [Ignavibacteriales bacterium]HOJ19189.1 VOC family protein [Ignavibacteriaceae bacterium]HPO56914.1 VOC family protein [Ignavibacteriaceae bacterium]